MIDIKQLRVGNFVLDGQSVVEVAEILSDSINTLQCEGVPFGELEPIPLTSEILELCGFEFIMNWTGKDKRKHDCTHFLDLGFCYLASGLMGLRITLFQSDNRSTGTDAEHLHQLQNLYFPLTNTELKIDIDNLKSVLK